MDPLVCLEVRHLAEGLPTCNALMGLLSSMDPLVYLEIRRFTKGLPTCTALVWLFPSMDHLVCLESRQMIKGYSVKMAPVQCNNSIRYLTETQSRRTNEDKLTTKQLGLPRKNLSIQQVSTKGGKSYIQELERKKIAWLMRSVFHIPLSLFIGFTVCFTVRFLH